jgi:hypothetical protein
VAKKAALKRSKKEKEMKDKAVFLSIDSAVCVSKMVFRCYKTADNLPAKRFLSDAWHNRQQKSRWWRIRSGVTALGLGQGYEEEFAVFVFSMLNKRTLIFFFRVLY